MTRAGAARWTEWALRLSLATAFLSGVGDRLGALGSHGSPHASWGDWHHFRIYADRLNWYMPAAVQPAAAVLATAGEVIFAIALSLAVMAADHKREIREGGNHESTVDL